MRQSVRQHGFRSALAGCAAALVSAALLSMTGKASADMPTTAPSDATAITAPNGNTAPNDKQPPETIVSPLGKTMTLKFHDEFNPVIDKDGQPYIDRSKWQTTFWQGSSQRTLWGNGEAQYYVDKNYVGDYKIPGPTMNPFSFETPGVLTISAWKVPQDMWKKYYMGKERCFASGLLISDKKFDFKYGYVEGRFKLPADRGAWPAFWLLGDDPSLGKPDIAHQWGPEIDIFEFFGHRPFKHSAGIIGRKGEKLDWKFGYDEVGFDISKDFHTWAMEWNADNVELLFDGHIWAHAKTVESLRRPMYLLINLAVGGNWYMKEMMAAGKPYHQWDVDESTMPRKMQCDYVRVYQ
jgi:beta-glucanase (GH16 family)